MSNNNRKEWDYYIGLDALRFLNLMGYVMSKQQAIAKEKIPNINV